LAKTGPRLAVAAALEAAVAALEAAAAGLEAAVVALEAVAGLGRAARRTSQGRAIP
jgi:hypothetical protein